jgi:hypothetical protein
MNDFTDAGNDVIDYNALVDDLHQVVLTALEGLADGRLVSVLQIDLDLVREFAADLWRLPAHGGLPAVDAEESLRILRQRQASLALTTEWWDERKAELAAHPERRVAKSGELAQVLADLADCDAWKAARGVRVPDVVPHNLTPASPCVRCSHSHGEGRDCR